MALFFSLGVQVIGSCLSAAAAARTLQQISLPVTPPVEIGSESMETVPQYMRKRGETMSELIQVRLDPLLLNQSQSVCEVGCSRVG